MMVCKVDVQINDALDLWRGVGLQFEHSIDPVENGGGSACPNPPFPGFIFAGKLFVQSPQGPRCFCIWHDGTSTAWVPCCE